MAGGHVGEILQQPQRCQLRHAVGGPTVERKLAVRTTTFGHAGREILRQREHVIGPEDAAKPLGLRAARRSAGREESTVVNRPLGRGHCHLALSAHHLEPLADRFFAFTVQRAEVVDITREFPGLSRMPQR